MAETRRTMGPTRKGAGTTRDATLPHHGRGLPEQDPPLLLGRDPRLGVDRFRLLVGAHSGWALPDRFEPALEVREILKLLPLALVRNDPRIARRVRDRVVAGDKGAIGETLVENAVQAVGLVHITLDRVGIFLDRVMGEVVVL